MNYSGLIERQGLEKKSFFCIFNLSDEKDRALVFETVTKFLPSVRLKSRNNLRAKTPHTRLHIS